ncbi:hypothetical protein HE1_00666 [Holospora elegans E1]|uniref:Uncharacterized protein n=1 Tax=Holospora elegans E1 TaxID=1427503 RepID=A0A023DZ70_9PROT|nr:hypothetical protein HE1_00666 [Holospora elegans E1]
MSMHMNVFLFELVRKDPSDKIALIMDGARWNKSKALKIPTPLTKDIFFRIRKRKPFKSL